MNMAGISPLHGDNRFGYSFLRVVCVLFLRSALLNGAPMRIASRRELMFVLLVMREGDRAPLGTYPTDPNKNYNWPLGFGQLTTTGIGQQHLLGEMLRRRYDTLLGPEYHPSAIYVRSIDLDRSIMSAQANLAGLFPPIGKQIWSQKIPWQPIPVHTVPLIDDRLLNFPIKNCSRFDRLIRDTLTRRDVHDKVLSFMKLFVVLSSNTKYEVNTLMNLTNHHFQTIYDALTVQRSHSLRLPTWANWAVLADMEKVKLFAMNLWLGIHETKLKSRVQGGVLLKDILEKITKVSHYGFMTRMVIYSTNEMAIISLQMALNVFKDKLPHVAACYFFELYREYDGTFTVEMYFRNTNHDEKPEMVTLYGCTDACPLEKFKQLVAPVIADDLEKECSRI